MKFKVIQKPHLHLMLFCFLCILSNMSAFAHQSYNLEDCISAAAKKSELLADQDEQIIQADERVSQIRGSLLPNLSASAAYFVQQSPADPVAQSFFPSSQPTVKFTLTQPLFRGLREFATWRQMNRLKEAQEHSKDFATIQMTVDVSNHYYTLISLEDELKNLNAQVRLYDDRIDELKQRARTGQSSASDALSAQASKAAVEAQVKQTLGQRKASWETFSFLTGLPRDSELIRPTVQFNRKFSVNDYLNSIETRPDIRAAKEKVEAFEEAVTSAKGAHLPTADFLGNYYLVRPTGVFNEIKWDFQATLTLPLFAGGTIQSKVGEAASQRTQAELALSRSRRLAEQEVRALFENYQSGLEQIDALVQSMQLAEKNYALLKKDYTRGLTRNIEVLQGLSQFQDSKRALDRARWSTQSYLTQLQIISNVRPLASTRN